MQVLLLFIDGLGMGKRDPQSNPLAQFGSRYLPVFADQLLPLPSQGLLLPTRVDMDLPGLPQSATGQTALFTGRNAAQELGRHLSGFPSPSLRRMLDESSLFREVRARGRRGVFANALSQQYFEQRGERISATTRALLAGGFPWLDMDDLRAGRAVSHDLTNEFLRAMHLDVPLRSPHESAQILAQIAVHADVTLFEFVLTDFIGHRQDMAGAGEVVRRLDILLEVVLASLDLDQVTVVLTSDHGNFEDLSIKTHTKNLVPTCVWGAGRHLFPSGTLRIEHIAGYLLSVLGSRAVK